MTRLSSNTPQQPTNNRRPLKSVNELHPFILDYLHPIYNCSPMSDEMITLRILDTKNKILEGIEKCGGNITRACEFAGITPPTYYEYIKDDEAFKIQAYEGTRQAKEIRLEEINDSLYNQATHPDKPNVIAGIFLAKTLGRSHSDPSKQVNDSPPVEAQKAIESSESITESSSAVQDLMKQFVIDVSKADQKSKSIEGETIDTKQAQDK